MNGSLRTTVIITSHNYATFLRSAIQSALEQTVGAVEVIVVDDGSTDDSPQIIRSFGGRIAPILKPNGGQASAINAGFAASRGDLLIFLDSDDVLLSDAVRNILDRFDDPSVGKVHWSMRVIDEQGKITGRLIPQQPLSDGDQRQTILKDGPEAYEWPPTSGNAWRRAFLHRVLPIPEEAFRVCPDLYLAALVPMFGSIRRIDEPQSLWRMHGGNNTWLEPFQARLPRFIRQWDLACEALADYCRAEGLPAAPERWRRNAWCHRVQRAVDRLCSIIPAGLTFVLIDGNDWGASEEFFGRRCLPFTERQGRYWGPPASDQSAIDELERQRAAGATFAVLAWPCFWWRDHYPHFLQYLQKRYRIALDESDLLVFDLTEPLL